MTWAGQSTDLSFLDPINRADTPPRGIQLAAGELSLRVLETRRRLDAGLGPIQDTIQRCRMAGKPGRGRASDKGARGDWSDERAPMLTLLICRRTRISSG